jgi:hypothetical protein
MSQKMSVLDKTMNDELVQFTIDEAVWKCTQKHSQVPHRAIKFFLVDYAENIWRLMLRNSEIIHIDSEDWEEDLWDRTHAVLKPDLDQIIADTLFKVSNKFSKVWWKLNKHSLLKIAQVTSVTSQMILSKLNPKLLKSTPEELK